MNEDKSVFMGHSIEPSLITELQQMWKGSWVNKEKILSIDKKNYSDLLKSNLTPIIELIQQQLWQ